MKYTYTVGETAEVLGTITATATGKSADPDTLTCTVYPPSGSSFTVPIEGADGSYLAEVPLDQEGDHVVRVKGTGKYRCAKELCLKVRHHAAPVP